MALALIRTKGIQYFEQLQNTPLSINFSTNFKFYLKMQCTPRIPLKIEFYKLVKNFTVP
jgi:hypothetical protein